MVPREELISSAITFLQDPSVASSAVEKRIEFLKSKNLTQEEIDLSLARASEVAPTSQSQNAPYYAPQQSRGPPQGYKYPYNPYGEWQPPPPEPPKRDWRDYFIMATVVGGAGYGLWILTQRYIKPLIAPPTPPQLEQDKAAIDEQFARAFALLDTLSADTAALKEAEESRTQRLDTAIKDVESIVAELRTANQKREDDARRMEGEIRGMKESLPRAIDSVKDGNEKQLKDLSSELGSLKLLMGNRMGGGSSSGSTMPPPSYRPQSGASTPATEAPPASAPSSSGNATGLSGASTYPFASSFAVPGFASSTASRPKSTTPFGAAGVGNKAAIPLWQMEAQKKATDMAATNSPVLNGAASGSSSSQPPDGADAVAALSGS